MECYIISAESFIIPLLSTLLAAFWIMVPAYVPNPVAALCGGGTPIDFHKNYADGRRIFGDGKTYRGLMCGVLAGIADRGTADLARRCIWLDIPPPAYRSLDHNPRIRGTPWGYGKEFYQEAPRERRGESWPIADQYDLVAGAFILMLVFDPAWLFATITLPILIVILILTPLLHRAVNIIGFLCGVKKEPW